MITQEDFIQLISQNIGLFLMLGWRSKTCPGMIFRVKGSSRHLRAYHITEGLSQQDRVLCSPRREWCYVERRVLVIVIAESTMMIPIHVSEFR